MVLFFRKADEWGSDSSWATRDPGIGVESGQRLGNGAANH
jgi:hypothetical protein